MKKKCKILIKKCPLILNLKKKKINTFGINNKHFIICFDLDARQTVSPFKFIILIECSKE